jgi:hypothetical protein
MLVQFPGFQQMQELLIFTKAISFQIALRIEAVDL